MSNEEIVIQIQQGKNRHENLALLWEQNQGLIDSTVHRLTGLQSYEEGFEDARQQSYFGILEAVENYSPEMNVKFFTYAENRIKRAIYRYHANCGYIVKVPEYLRLRLKKYNRFCQEYREHTGKWPEDEACTKSLHISRKALNHLKKLNVKMSMKSLEEQAENCQGKTVGELIPDNGDLEELITGSVYLRELHEILTKSVNLLPDEEKEVVRMRFYQGYTVKEIAKKIHSSKQTVHNRLKEAYQRIKGSEYREILELFRDNPFEEPEEKEERKWQIQGLEETEKMKLML